MSRQSSAPSPPARWPTSCAASSRRRTQAKGILARLCADAGVTVLLCAPVVDAIMDGRRVVGVRIDTPSGPRDIRYGALLPKGIDGLLVAGRCISGTHRAHASYRVMTPCMAMGEAAGVAAALAAAKGVASRDVAPAAIRTKLVKRGVALGVC